MENTHTLKMDITDPKLSETVKELIKRPADVLLSDLSPKISGAWDLDQYRQIDLTITSITIGDTLLRVGGNACSSASRENGSPRPRRRRAALQLRGHHEAAHEQEREARRCTCSA